MRKDFCVFAAIYFQLSLNIYIGFLIFICLKKCSGKREIGTSKTKPEFAGKMQVSSPKRSRKKERSANCVTMQSLYFLLVCFGAHLLQCLALSEEQMANNSANYDKSDSGAQKSTAINKSNSRVLTTKAQTRTDNLTDTQNSAIYFQPQTQRQQQRTRRRDRLDKKPRTSKAGFAHENFADETKTAQTGSAAKSEIEQIVRQQLEFAAQLQSKEAGGESEFATKSDLLAQFAHDSQADAAIEFPNHKYDAASLIANSEPLQEASVEDPTFEASNATLQQQSSSSDSLPAKEQSSSANHTANDSSGFVPQGFRDLGLQHQPKLEELASSLDQTPNKATSGVELPAKYVFRSRGPVNGAPNSASVNRHQPRGLSTTSRHLSPQTANLSLSQALEIIQVLSDRLSAANLTLDDESEAASEDSDESTDDEPSSSESLDEAQRPASESSSNNKSTLKFFNTAFRAGFVRRPSANSSANGQLASSTTSAPTTTTSTPSTTTTTTTSTTTVAPVTLFASRLNSDLAARLSAQRSSARNKHYWLHKSNEVSGIGNGPLFGSTPSSTSLAESSRRPAFAAAVTAASPPFQLSTTPALVAQPSTAAAALASAIANYHHHHHHAHVHSIKPNSLPLFGNLNAVSQNQGMQRMASYDSLIAAAAAAAAAAATASASRAQHSQQPATFARPLAAGSQQSNNLLEPQFPSASRLTTLVSDEEGGANFGDFESRKLLASQRAPQRLHSAPYWQHEIKTLSDTPPKFVSRRQTSKLSSGGRHQEKSKLRLGRVFNSFVRRFARKSSNSNTLELENARLKARTALPLPPPLDKPSKSGQRQSLQSGEKRAPSPGETQVSSSNDQNNKRQAEASSQLLSIEPLDGSQSPLRNESNFVALSSPFDLYKVSDNFVPAFNEHFDKFSANDKPSYVSAEQLQLPEVEFALAHYANSGGPRANPESVYDESRDPLLNSNDVMEEFAANSDTQSIGKKRKTAPQGDSAAKMSSRGKLKIGSRPLKGAQSEAQLIDEMPLKMFAASGKSLFAMGANSNSHATNKLPLQLHPSASPPQVQFYRVAWPALGPALQQQTQPSLGLASNAVAQFAAEPSSFPARLSHKYLAYAGSHLHAPVTPLVHSQKEAQLAELLQGGKLRDLATSESVITKFGYSVGQVFWPLLVLMVPIMIVVAIVAQLVMAAPLALFGLTMLTASRFVGALAGFPLADKAKAALQTGSKQAPSGEAFDYLSLLEFLSQQQKSELFGANFAQKLAQSFKKIEAEFEQTTNASNATIVSTTSKPATSDKRQKRLARLSRNVN